jgi:hypothetical protein
MTVDYAAPRPSVIRTTARRLTVTACAGRRTARPCGISAIGG